MQGNYRKRFIAGMVAYVVLLPVSLLLLRSEALADRESTLMAILAGLVALIPVLPFLYAMTAVVGGVQGQDELKQRMNLEAVLITTLLTGGLTFSYGLLQSAGLVPDLPMTVIAPFMIFVWGLANAYVSRRYE